MEDPFDIPCPPETPEEEAARLAKLRQRAEARVDTDYDTEPPAEEDEDQS